jgi:dCMP deaminase
MTQSMAKHEHSMWRPNWHVTRLAMARELARRSLCVRDRVGALIVDAEGKIIGEGYNGPPRGYRHSGLPCDRWCQRSIHSQPNATIVEPIRLAADYSDCPALHAEANALSMSDRSLRQSGWIYVTSHVCFPCAKLIANSGLLYVRVDAAKAHAHRRADASYEFLRDCGLEVFVTEAAG